MWNKQSKRVKRILRIVANALDRRVSRVTIHRNELNQEGSHEGEVCTTQRVKV